MTITLEGMSAQEDRKVNVVASTANTAKSTLSKTQQYNTAQGQRRQTAPLANKEVT